MNSSIKNNFFSPVPCSLITVSDSKRNNVQFISISWLNGSLHLHLRPINLVIFQETVLHHLFVQLFFFKILYTKMVQELPNLGRGFPLICFQRLSLPNVATQRCGWRHSWYTRGSFSKVLSYYQRLPSSNNAYSR